jgi:hypothetical protein
MTPEYRKKLLSLNAKTERLIREAEVVPIGPTDDEILFRTSKVLAEMRESLAEIERKLRYDDQD